MIDDLPADVRALVAASRASLAPDAATVARLQSRIHTAVAGGAAAGMAVGVKLALVAVAVATVSAIGAIAYVRYGSSASVPMFAPETTKASDPDPEVAPRITSRERETAPLPVVPELPVCKPALAAPALAAPAPVASLAREIELVDQATAALHRNDHAAVLSAIRSYDAETAGHGQLAEDAAAIALEATCRSHDPTAAARLAAFTTRWPHSAQHTRLATVCHEGDRP